MKNENKLTWSNPDGTWGLKNYDIQNVPRELYGAMCKLHDYEKTDLSPDEVETMKEDFFPAEAAVYLRECTKKDTGWIPCSERLPEEKINPVTEDFYEYQVTFKSEGIEDIRHYTFCNGHWWHYGQNMDEYVIAWQPLPEPYMPGRRK